jgi:hypothetical protein
MSGENVSYVAALLSSLQHCSIRMVSCSCTTLERQKQHAVHCNQPVHVHADDRDMGFDVDMASNLVPAL